MRPLSLARDQCVLTAVPVPGIEMTVQKNATTTRLQSRGEDLYVFFLRLLSCSRGVVRLEREWSL